MPQALRMQAVAAAPWQTLSPDEHDPCARLGRQACGQCHGVGRFAKERRPLAHALGRHLVGQQPHGAPGAQGLDHLTHPRERGGHSFQSRPVAGRFHHLGQTWLPRRSVQHRQSTMRLRKPAGQGLGGDFKTAQMRRQKQHALTALISLQHGAVIVPMHWHGWAKPQTRQLGRHGPGMANGRGHLPEAESGLAGVVHEAAPVHRRQQPGQPAARMPKGVQSPQRPAAEEMKPKLHEAGFCLFPVQARTRPPGRATGYR